MIVAPFGEFTEPRWVGQQGRFRSKCNPVRRRAEHSIVIYMYLVFAAMASDNSVYADPLHPEATRLHPDNLIITFWRQEIRSSTCSHAFSAFQKFQRK